MSSHQLRGLSGMQGWTKEHSVQVGCRVPCPPVPSLGHQKYLLPSPIGSELKGCLTNVQLMRLRNSRQVAEDPWGKALRVETGGGISMVQRRGMPSPTLKLSDIQNAGEIAKFRR